MSQHDPKDPALIAKMGADPEVTATKRALFDQSATYRYSYNFKWLGRPIIQYPEDIVALQEIIWATQPAAIVETGIAHGGSLVFHASMLELLGGDRLVVGVDIDIRAHNRAAIEAHPLAKRIHMIQGSSIDPATVAQVRAAVGARRPVMVILDSNHTHEHVARELELYAPLVSAGMYLVVFDTVVEDMRPDAFPDRPWGRGNNPKTAVHAFLAQTDRFAIDDELDGKLLMSVAPNGYLRCLKDA